MCNYYSVSLAWCWESVYLENISSDPQISPLLELGLSKGIESVSFMWTLEITENLGNIKYPGDQNLSKGRDFSVDEKTGIKFHIFSICV